MLGPLGGLWLDQVVGLSAELCAQARVPPGPPRLVSKHERIGERVDPGSVRFADMALVSVTRSAHLADAERKRLVHRPIAEGESADTRSALAAQRGLDPQGFAAAEPVRRHMSDLDVGR